MWKYECLTISLRVSHTETASGETVHKSQGWHPEVIFFGIPYQNDNGSHTADHHGVIV